jgi:putative DNA primase/helicase
VPLDEPNLGCLLTENAKFFKWSTDRNGEAVAHDVHPPDWLIKAILAKGFWPGIRELLAVAECPYVKPDGSVMSKAGYEPSTGSVMAPCFELGKIPNWPTKEDAKEAVDRLYRRVSEFPFGDGFDWSAWLAALLTAIQRPAIAGPVPGFAFNGNKAGCGKGLLIDLIGILVWGGPIPTVSYPANPEEAEKVTLALALGGVQAVHFDNLEEGQFYGGSAIDSAMTSTVKGGRILGQSRYVNGVPLRPCWALSGNNISPGKDAHRRWIPSALRTDLEKPHERSDVTIKNLKVHFAEHRGEIVADAITILKAHALAGRPSPAWGPLGSFEEWDETIRGAVWYANGNDCLTTQRRAADESPRRLEKLALLEAWQSLPDGATTGYTAQEVLELAEEERPDLEQIRAALMPLGSKGKLPTAAQLGYKLRAMKLENVGGYRFMEVAKRHQATVWAARKVI